ncbi:MAG: D-alanine--D-alanine ligase [Anaerolineales bacterium]|nr:D-alanine--D-alanine ligase [Anaerolineales bacterium]
MTQKYRIGVLFGGRSSEHEVSLASAQNVMDALRQAGHTVIPIGILPSGQWLPRPDAHVLLAERAVEEHHGRAGSDPGEGWGLLPHAAPEAPLPDIDVIFPVLHGPYGEDGTVQGLLEMANLPYVGCGVLASALAMDKIMARRIFAEAKLPQVPYVALNRAAWRSDPNAALAEIERTLGYPVFVKPANLGSSVGISKARDRNQLVAALHDAARFDRKLLIEAAVPDAREIEVSVLGNVDPAASVPGEIIPGNEFYDYQAKYIADNSELIIPARLDAAVTAQVRKLAVAAFKALDCEGLARVDFLLDGSTNEIYLNEVNTMPGFTRISMYPKLWEATGVNYPELVDRLVQLALERYSDRQENCTTL